MEGGGDGGGGGVERGGEGGVGCRHGLINYIDTKPKCPVCKGTSRQVFIRLEIQSVMLVFSTQLCELLPLSPSLQIQSVMLVIRLSFVNRCPSPLLSGSTLPPPPPSLSE
jgi:hypothetical protein